MPHQRHEGTTVEPGQGPVVFLDALCVKIRDDGAVRNKAIDLTCREGGRRTSRLPPPGEHATGKMEDGAPHRRKEWILFYMRPVYPLVREKS